MLDNSFSTVKKSMKWKPSFEKAVNGRINKIIPCVMTSWRFGCPQATYNDATLRDFFK